ncbi:uracil-DNA glycosylase family protein [Silvimonas amylolytica]|uniref:Uracil-DNA glycosylase n=1 Tax=Silvimonas amylolytica TaxID=449663 RepID=A0ABQ2PKG7_9NEIS|nr:uracil-DNA glycosylase family protein [Silvimonas amylolytica]GGP25507.1 uracil-DNA glycosylase [Silvimonas amylolytica]
MISLQNLLTDIRACRECTDLPLGPRPVLVADARARILVIGQAPGTKVHASGVPWSDASGLRLRQWLGVDDATFYDPAQFAIVPMGFCYPGKGKSGDLPPRAACSALWHPQLLPLLPNIELVLAIGQYAQAFYLGNARQADLTTTVRAWRDYAPRTFVLPHPSPRNQLWLKRNPWFEEEVVPALQGRVAHVLTNGCLVGSNISCQK